MMHLWEVDHSYYCAESNYYAPGNDQPFQAYKSWAEFAAEGADSDLDMNLVFRWDWREGEDWGAGEFTGDINYRNGKLLIHFMGQRKGLYRWAEVAVCRADEPAVIAYLRPRLDHLLALWAPMREGEAERAAGSDSTGTISSPPDQLGEREEKRGRSSSAPTEAAPDGAKETPRSAGGGEP